MVVTGTVLWSGSPTCSRLRQPEVTSEWALLFVNLSVGIHSGFFRSHFAAHAQRQQSWAAWLAIKVSYHAHFSFLIKALNPRELNTRPLIKGLRLGHHAHETHFERPKRAALKCSVWVQSGSSIPGWPSSCSLTPVCKTSFFQKTLNRPTRKIIPHSFSLIN